MSSGFVSFPNALADSCVRCPRIYSWSNKNPLLCVSQTFGSVLRRASGPISLEYGALAAGPAGGGPAAGADDADVVFTTVGVFAATFAADLFNVGYSDAVAAAFAGGGDGGFAGFGAGDFAGFGAGGLVVCFNPDAPRRLDASTCISLGGCASSLGAGAGLVAPLAFPVLLDLALSVGVFDIAFGFGAGADDGLAMPHGVFFVIRLIVVSLLSCGKRSDVFHRVGAGVIDGSNSATDASNSGGDGDAVVGLSFRRFSARL